ncbi:hypothetical protein [Dysgonomonas sp. 25]|uniref:hypothetical protein n=1 Tax=Dysgonomonas sp. 25 TaxID=2302933 RepID=UPI0013D6558D|nr:hypothetical protein [Dysgonomonas sp. 25]NDV69444.1 hypothetical protein [Dysgonomonas sp. 25]
MSKSLSTTLLLTALILLASCTGTNAEEEAKALLAELNKSTGHFQEREELFKARTAVISSINRNILNPDSVFMVESIDKAGNYQCISYVAHNKMTTFYNARKAKNRDEQDIGEYIQTSADITPYEALSFVDAFQNSTIEQYLEERNAAKIAESGKNWILSFIVYKDDQYTIKNHISK